MNDLNKLAKKIHGNNVEKGFDSKKAHFALCVALIHSEVSEALEADRSGKRADLKAYTSKIPFSTAPLIGKSAPVNVEAFREHIKDTVEDELADVVIRVLDYCGAHNIDISKHVALKVQYNETREHKHGGKFY